MTVRAWWPRVPVLRCWMWWKRFSNLHLVLGGTRPLASCRVLRPWNGSVALLWGRVAVSHGRPSEDGLDLVLEPSAAPGRPSAQCECTAAHPQPNRSARTWAGAPRLPPAACRPRRVGGFTRGVFSRGALS